MKKGEEKLMDSISVQVIYHTLKQHSEAFKKMGIELQKVEREVIELSTDSDY
jgi:hypothetical protein